MKLADYTGKLNNHKDYLKAIKQLEKKCRYIEYVLVDEEDTDFGINDIAFFDEKDLPLLFTTTHEGYITIRDDLF